VPLEPAAAEPVHDRRRQHQVVRFERREAPHGAPEPVNDLEPVRELRQGRRKNHVVVRFEQAHDGSNAAEPDGWQLFDQAEA
jgi:hypothetical protein